MTYTDVAPSISVAKTASPNSVNEGGVGSQSVTYTFTVTNTSAASTDPVTIQTLTDSVLGTLTGSATCQVGTVLAPRRVLHLLRDHHRTVTVNNVNPVASAGTDKTEYWGMLIAFTGTSTDVGTQDKHTATWAFGHGDNGSGYSVAHS